MSLRKTSCTACVSAKKRCDREIPACRRCTQKSVLCEYPYPLGSQSNASPQTPQDDPLLALSMSSGQWEWMNNTPPLPTVGEIGLGDYSIGPMAGLAGSPLDLLWDTQHLPESPGLQHTSDGEKNPEDGTFESPLGPLLDTRTSTRSRSVSEARGYRQVSTHRRKQDHRNSQRRRQNILPAFSITRPLPTFDIWPRGRDVETWNFCARELMSFVTSFAATGSSPFILHPALHLRIKPHGHLHASLQRALGVCAAHSTLDGPNQHFFTELLETEVQQLTESSKLGNTLAIYPSISDTHRSRSSSALLAFREGLVRLQTMILYQIIGLFSNDAARQRTAKKHEALMASWTRELLLQIQVLELQSQGVSSSPSTSSACSSLSTPELAEVQYHDSLSDESLPNSLPLLWNIPLQEEEMISAYRTILLSYLIRSVYSAMVYQTCTLLAELGSLPVLVPQDGQQKHNELGSVSRQELWGEIRNIAETEGLLQTQRQTIPYEKFVDLWNRQNWIPGLEGYDRFTVLILVACKGVDIVKASIS